MIQKYQSSQIQNVTGTGFELEFIEQIIRIKHHQEMIDNRHLRIFLKYFGDEGPPFTRHQAWARDILRFSEQKQLMKRLYQMQTIIKLIRECVLTRVRVDHIAPILRRLPGEQNPMFEMRKWNRAMMQLPESKTMHSGSNQKYQKCKLLIVGNITRSTKQTPQQESQSNDLSSDTLSKVTHDLSRMLKDIYGYDDKSFNLSFKFPKHLDDSPTTSQKNLKKNLLLHNISAIRCTNKQEHCINPLNCEYYPQEHYGPKRPRKVNSKSNETRMRRKLKQGESVESKWRSRRTNLVPSKIQSQDRAEFLTLTPKPVSSSKLREQDCEHNKCSSRCLTKTNRKDTVLSKLQKSPVYKKQSPYKELVEQKSQLPKKERPTHRK